MLSLRAAQWQQYSTAARAGGCSLARAGARCYPASEQCLWKETHMAFPARVDSALFALLLLAMAGHGVAFAAHMLTQLDIFYLVRDLYRDDAFYYFEIASNMAEGQFSTFDGGITRTNGYHPLWLWLITPIYWLLDKEAALLAIKALEILLIAGAAMLVAGAARLARLPWILLVGLLPALYQVPALYYGLEAAVGLFSLALFMLALVLYGRDAARWRRLLAAVAFALPWARLEYVAISLAGTGALLLLEWTWQERPRGELKFTSPNLRTFVPMFGALAGILSYFAYNQLVFGGPVPVSGATKRVWSQYRWQASGGYDLLQNLREMMALRVFDDELPVAAGIIVGAALLWWLLRRSRRRGDRLLLVFLTGVFSLAAGHVAWFAQSALVMHPRRMTYATWYYVPAYLLMALVAPVAAIVALTLLRRFVAPRFAGGAGRLQVAVVTGGALLLAARADVSGPFRYVEKVERNETAEIQMRGHTSAEILNRALPEGSIVGSWDSGKLGYFLDFPVVNLDGLANDYEYLRKYTEQGQWGGGVYSQQETFAQTLHEAFGINWYIFFWIDLDMQNEGRVTYPLYEVTEQSFRLWAAGSAGEAEPGAFWELLSPKFDRLAGGVGLVVDGRVAQAFAQECGPGDTLLWRWSQDGEERSARNAWTRTETGLCVSARLLPQGAGPEVRAETLKMEALVAELIGDAAPAIEADFEVWLAEGQLVYWREDCAAEDMEATFFLHLVPLDVGDLPLQRQEFGFDNLDFDFEQYGARNGATCLAVVSLPGYGIAEIRTGQSVARGDGFENLWQGTLRPD